MSPVPHLSPGANSLLSCLFFPACGTAEAVMMISTAVVAWEGQLPKGCVCVSTLAEL